METENAPCEHEYRILKTYWVGPSQVNGRYVVHLFCKKCSELIITDNATEQEMSLVTGRTEDPSLKPVSLEVRLSDATYKRMRVNPDAYPDVAPYLTEEGQK